MLYAYQYKQSMHIHIQGGPKKLPYTLIAYISRSGQAIETKKQRNLSSFTSPSNDVYFRDPTSHRNGRNSVAKKIDPPKKKLSDAGFQSVISRELFKPE